MNHDPSTSLCRALQESKRASEQDKREAWSDRVAQPSRSVPPLGQRTALVVRALGRGQQVIAESPVADHQPGRNTDAALRGLREQDIDRGRVVGSEDQRGGGAGPHQPGQEVASHATGIVHVGQPGLLRQRTALEPVEQRHAERADHAHLREVHVGVDEPRQDEARGQVDHLLAGVAAPQLGERSARGDDAVAHQ